MTLHKGKPTGHLTDTQMEVELYLIDEQGTRVKCGTQWVPLTQEMRAKIMDQNTAVVSMGASVAQVEIARSLETIVDSNSHVTFSRIEANTEPSVLTSGDQAESEVPAVESSTYVVGVGLTSGGIQPQGCSPPRKDDQEVKRENSGGNVSYYSVEVKHPKRPERAPYIFEVEDLIQALNMNFGEGTVLKSLVRSCVEREFGIGKQGTDYIRDAEKMVHSSQEVLRARRIEKEKK